MPRPPGLRSRTGDMLLLAVCVSAVSLSSILIRWSTSTPIQIAFYRLAFTSVMVLPLVHWSRFAFPGGHHSRVLMILSGVALALHFILWITSLQYTSVTESVLLVSTHPLLVTIGSSMFLREPPSGRAAAGIVLGILGTAIIVLSGLGRPDILGDTLAVMGGVALTVYILIGRSLRQSIPVGNYVLPVYVTSMSVVLLAALLLGSGLQVDDPREYMLFLLMALVPGMLGHTLYNHLLRRLRAYVVSVSLLAEPVGAGLLAFLLLSELPRPSVIPGGVIVLLGIYLVVSEGTDHQGKVPGG